MFFSSKNKSIVFDKNILRLNILFYFNLIDKIYFIFVINFYLNNYLVLSSVIFYGCNRKSCKM